MPKTQQSNVPNGSPNTQKPKTKNSSLCDYLNLITPLRLRLKKALTQIDGAQINNFRAVHTCVISQDEENIRNNVNESINFYEKRLSKLQNSIIELNQNEKICLDQIENKLNSILEIIFDKKEQLENHLLQFKNEKIDIFEQQIDVIQPFLQELVQVCA